MTLEEQWLLKEKYSGVESDAFKTDCERLACGEPLAYLIGHSPFLDTTIYLDSRPLIPRPETEFWTEKVITELKELVFRGQTPKLNVLDLCAGSGCIGVAIAKAVPNAHVDFVEIDEKHHPTIQKNIKENGIETKRIRIFGGDLFENVPNSLEATHVDEIRGMGESVKEPYQEYGDEPIGTHNKEVRHMRGFYDVIVSNPPYIDPHKDRSDADVRAFEPHLALYGGNKGIELIQAIITDAPKYLKENGVLYIEHEPAQKKLIQQCAAENSLLATSHRDQYDFISYTRLKK